MGNRGSQATAQEQQEPFANGLFSMETDEEERWVVIAETSTVEASQLGGGWYVEVQLDADSAGARLESPGIGVVSSSGLSTESASSVPEVAFIVASGWVVKDSSIGPMRMEACEDMCRSEQSFSAAGVWIKNGNVAFYRQPSGTSTWHCSGELDGVLAHSASVRVLARRAGGAILPSKDPRQLEPPCPPKKVMAMHWKGTAPVPWYETAVRRRDLPRLQAGVQAGLSVCVKDSRLENGMHHCVRRGWLDGLRALLATPDAPEAVDAPSVFRRTPLLEAALRSDAEAAGLLLHARANINFQGGCAWEQRACSLQKTKEHRSPLHHAADLGSLELLRVLLGAGAVLDMLDAKGKTPLRLAVEGDVDDTRSGVVELLLDARANPNPPMDSSAQLSVTPLHTAARWGFAEVADLLLASRAVPDRGIEQGALTPLMLAAKGRSSGHSRIITALIDAQADVQIVSAQGKTATELARLNRAPPESLHALEAAAAVPHTTIRGPTLAAECPCTDAPRIVLETSSGRLVLVLRPDAAPKTVQHILRIVDDHLYDGCCFYRSDVVIQWGLQKPDGSRVKSPYPALSVNETACAVVLANTRGAAAVAHWDIPDCGNSEIFISLQSNHEFDTVGGGYCVFAEVADSESLETVDAIAAAIPQGQKPEIHRALVVR